ncbi:MAG: SPASM domain-containing protein [Myxococcales bacterium]
MDKGGNPTFKRVWRAVQLLRRHGVRFNTLTTVHAANGDRPLEVYRFLRDEVGSSFLQFIPIVERAGEGDQVTARSVRPRQYGRFLTAVFDEWVRRDVGTVFVQIFEAALASWVGAPPTLCIFAPTCGDAMALEHNGDLYSCDHFVEPRHRLGNLRERTLGELAASEPQRRFGEDKQRLLPDYCRRCPVLFACNGGCPKERFRRTPEGEPGLNYLCAGYKDFFLHIDQPMRQMAAMLRQGRNADEVMAWMAAEDARLDEALAGTGPNQPCPCGSGRKAKQCHRRDAKGRA